MTYVTDAIAKEAVVSGVALVDAHNQPIRYVPGQTLNPGVLITELTPSPNFSPDTGNAQIHVTATIRDPIAVALEALGATEGECQRAGRPGMLNEPQAGNYVLNAALEFHGRPRRTCRSALRARSLAATGWMTA